MRVGQTCLNYFYKKGPARQAFTKALIEAVLFGLSVVFDVRRTGHWPCNNQLAGGFVVVQVTGPASTSWLDGLSSYRSLALHQPVGWTVCHRTGHWPCINQLAGRFAPQRAPTEWYVLFCGVCHLEGSRTNTDVPSRVFDSYTR